MKANYRVQCKGSRVGAKFLTMAFCETKEHAEFVAKGLAANTSLIVKITKVK